MTKKVLLLINCFLFGALFAQDFYYLRVDSKCHYEFAGKYRDGSVLSCMNNPKKNKGFVKIKKYNNGNELKRICVYGICKKINCDVYRHYCYKGPDDCSWQTSIPVWIYNPSAQEGEWKCVMILDNYWLGILKTLGGVCVLDFCDSKVLARPAATFEMKEDVLPGFPCEDKVGMNTSSESSEEESVDDDY